MLDQFVVDLSSPGARRLFEYWVHGKGAVKVRWGTDGSFDRCVRHLRDKVRDPQGLCAEYHKAATGEWPAEKGIQSAAGLIVGTGLRWRALLTLIGKSTGDKRKINPGALSTRNLPLPLLWQREIVAGKHDGAVVVGLIDKVEISADAVYGEGELFTPDPLIMPRLAEDVAELRYITERGLGGPSVDIQLDDLVFEYQGNEAVVTQGRIAAATLVQVPAFAETKGAFEIYDHEGTLLASVGVMRPFELITLEQWEESKHPRDAEGKFKEKPGGDALAPPAGLGRVSTYEQILRHYSEIDEFGVRIRPALAEARSISEVEDAFTRELKRVGIRGEPTIRLDGLDVLVAQEYSEGILRVFEVFPDTKFKGTFTWYPESHHPDEGSEGVIAFAEWDRRISFNRVAGGHEGRRVRGDLLSAASGFNNTRGRPLGTGVHEAWHMLHYSAGGDGPFPHSDRDTERLNIRLIEALRDYKVKGGHRGEYGISQYADKTTWELVADAGADVTLSGEGAAPASKKVLEVLLAEYERKGYRVSIPKRQAFSPQERAAKEAVAAVDELIDTRDPSKLMAMDRKKLLDAIDKLGMNFSPDDSDTTLRLRLIGRGQRLRDLARPMLEQHQRRPSDSIDRFLVMDRDQVAHILSLRNLDSKELAKELGIKVPRKSSDEDVDKMILDRLFGPEKELDVEPEKPKVDTPEVEGDGEEPRIFRQKAAGGPFFQWYYDYKGRRYGPYPQKVVARAAFETKFGKGGPPEPPVLIPDDFAKFRYYLELRRDAAGSVAALAKEMGVNSSTLAGWLKGRKPRDRDLVARILADDDTSGIEEVKINPPEVDRVNNAFDSLVDSRDRSKLEGLTTEDLRDAAKTAGIKGLRANASRDTLIKRLLEVAHGKRVDKPGFGHFVDRLYAVSRTEGRKVLKDRGTDLPLIADEADVDISGIYDDASIIKKILDHIHKPSTGPKLPDPPLPEREVPTRAKSYHLHTDGIEDLVAHVEGGFEGAERKQIVKGAQGGVKEKITLPDGTVLFGKNLGVDYVSGLARPAKEVADREQLASRLGQIIGAPVPRVYRVSDDQIYTDWAEGAVAWGVFKRNPERHRKVMESDAGALVGLLDMLSFNHDRHEGNLLIDRQDRLRGIDHGLSWSGVEHFLNDRTETAKKNRHWGFASGPMIDHYLSYQSRPGYKAGDYFKDNPLTQEDIAHIRAELKKLEPEFEHLDRADWYKATQETLDLLEPYAKGKRNLVAPEGEARTPEKKPEPSEFYRNPESVSDLAELAAEFDKGNAERKEVAYRGGSWGIQEKVTFADGRSMFLKDMSSAGTTEEFRTDIKERIDVEQLGTQLGLAIGAPVPRAYRDKDGRIFTEWIDGEPLSVARSKMYPDRIEMIEDAFFDSRAGMRLALLDTLMHNLDRHEFNLMVDHRGKVHGIDQGDGWWQDSIDEFYAESSDEGKFLHVNLGNILIDDDGYVRMTPGELDYVEAKLKAMRRDFELLDRKKWFDYSLDILRELKKIIRPGQ